MKDLKIELLRIESPYPNEKSSKYDLWGNIRLCFDSKILLDTQWNLLYFIEWFSENKTNLKYEKFPFHYIESIIKSRDILFEKDDFDNEKEEEAYFRHLENYFHHHFYRLKGTDTLLFYIGLDNSSIGEISYKDKGVYYKHNFDMSKFISHVDLQIEYYLHSLQLNKDQIEYLKDIIPEYIPYLNHLP